ncbi:universal stress protein [Noviherbaspirillum sp. Root189]|uniref:universal stress protein n=1 Tax=Noviherbaspirillum sp. Root189 TaxID=1736487 RepID=UPI00070A6982|nr:universal stress protein [Noviherbaspirillum sp. Root189]
MIKLKKILVATDHSPQARWAENRAAMLSVELTADLLDIMSMPGTLKTSPCSLALTNEKSGGAISLDMLLHERKLAGSTTSIASQPVCTRSTATSKPVTAMLERAKELAADLTVVAAKKRTTMVNFFTCQTNSELIRQSDRPILLVNSQSQAPYSRIIVAIDFSEHSREAALIALAVAPTAYFTFLNACHVTNEGIMREAGITNEVINKYRDKACEKARTRLNQFIDDLGPRTELIARAIQYGFPVPVICDRAKRLNADLIVIGKHGTSRLHELLLGSVAQRLIDHTTCDLLVVATPRRLCRENPLQREKAERKLGAPHAGDNETFISTGK